MPGALHQELAIPQHFEEVVQLVREEALAEKIPCGPDPEKHLTSIQKYIDAGYDHICIHQVGHDQEGFMDFYAREILPKFQ